MSRSSRYRVKRERPWKIHPIWRGIGFVWLILLPVMSYAAAWTLTRENFKHRWLPLTEDLAKQIRLPILNFSFLSFPLDFNIFIRWIPGQPLYNADFLFFLGFLMIGFGLMSVVYAFMYRAVTPGRGPFDAPEVESQRRRKRW
jgi:hypothetical protein